MRATVVRGYIMRMWRELEWEEELEEIDNMDDADAIPHYVEGPDGKYYEYYRHEMPEGKKVFVVKFEE